MEFVIVLLTSLWLGILTSISPCPLASNIAALSFLTRGMNQKGKVIFEGVFYILGRSFVYVFIMLLIVKISINVPAISMFLQTYMNKILGFFLVITGLFLFEIFYVNLPGIGLSDSAQQKFKKAGFGGAFVIGGIFALALCPVSAAIYFGSLLPLSLKAQSAVVIPAVYGIGTGLPVLLFAVLISFGTQYVSKFYNNLAKIEFFMQRITGTIFIIAGIYYILSHTFNLI